MKKRIFYTEASYFIGLIMLSLGTALMERADFGLSSIVAPAYLIHLKLSETFPLFTFGMAEYTLQAVLLLFIILLLRKFKVSYLFSFVTAVLYGLLLDGALSILSFLPDGHFGWRILYYIIGMLSCTFSISLLFHTYISPEAYELFVKEVAAHYHININKFKIAYDCVSLVIAVGLSFLFFGFGHFEGIHAGTFICAAVNGLLIGWFSHLLEKHWEFKDKFKFRKYFS